MKAGPMSLDAIVWLVAGAGLGVGASLLLLMVYSGLERWRLGRRMRRARLLRQVAAPAEPGPPAAASQPVVVALQTEPAARKAEVSIASRPISPPVAEPSEPPIGSPAQELVASKPKPALKLVQSEPVAVDQQARDPSASPSPTSTHRMTAAATPPKREVQSVEELFAEAFALDKVSVVPLARDGGESSKT